MQETLIELSPRSTNASGLEDILPVAPSAHQNNPPDVRFCMPRGCHLMTDAAARGWVNYFAVGDSRECFSFVRDWVETKVRGHLMRAGGRSGLGWNFAQANQSLGGLCC